LINGVDGFIPSTSEQLQLIGGGDFYVYADVTYDDPTPRKNEKNSEFMNRCMSNLSTKKNLPMPKQRAAVCYSQIARKKKG
jgi:hypothetical protein